MVYLTMIQIMLSKLVMIQNMMLQLCVSKRMSGFLSKIIKKLNNYRKCKIKKYKKQGKRIKKNKLLQELSKVHPCIGGFITKLFILEVIKTFRYRKIQD